MWQSGGFSVRLCKTLPRMILEYTLCGRVVESLEDSCQDDPRMCSMWQSGGFPVRLFRIILECALCDRVVDPCKTLSKTS